MSLLGKPDSNILKSSGGTDFHQFKFKSIGKEPELLRRISNREEGVRYQYSPSPEPEARYSPLPEPLPLPARNGAETRTRPSLLQALTSQPFGAQELPFSTAFGSFLHSEQRQMSAVESPGLDSMQLLYPGDETQPTAAATTFKPRFPSPPPPPPFVPDYAALKELHTRLETSHKVLAIPPPPKRAPTPTPDHLRLATNNVIHHTEKTHASAKEALEASKTRAAISEKGVAAAQTVVDTLTQALSAAAAALEVAQSSLVEARKAAEEAQAAFLASGAAADAAEETKKLLTVPPRPPTPEPVNDNAETIGEMKKDLDTLRMWVEEQEAGHLPAVIARRDTSRDREEEEEREASNMIIAPDDNDTDNEIRDAHETSAEPPATENPAAVEAKMDIDEPRRLEEDAAQALVELAEQKTTTQDEARAGRTLLHEKFTANGKAEPATAYSQAGHFPASELPADEAALAREAALRKQQDARREQVRIQKEQAHAAAALSILKERQDAAMKTKKPATKSSSPPSKVGAQADGNVVANNSPVEVKIKVKKSKPVSGGVKLGPENAAKVETPSTTEFSPALERAAALGLRVRTNSTKSGENQAAASAKPKKTRNHSLPPVSHLDDELSQPDDTDDIYAHRMGSDPGDIPIVEPTKAPAHVATDVQLMNLRHALQDEGITWEAISRSRPQPPGVKTEECEALLRTPGIASAAAPQPKPAPPPPQRPLPVNPPITTPTLSAPPPAAAPLPVAPKAPLPNRKQLPKFNKTAPQTAGAKDAQITKRAAAPIAAQSQSVPSLPPNGSTFPPSEAAAGLSKVKARASEVPATATPTKWAPPAAFTPAIVATAQSNTAATKAATANNGPIQVQPLPRVQTEPRSFAASGGSTQHVNGSSSYHRAVNERESDPWRPRYGAISPPPRARTPDRDRYGGTVPNPYRGGEPERYDRRTPESFARPPSPAGFRRTWTPRSPPRRPASPVRRPPSPVWRAPSPPPRPQSPLPGPASAPRSAKRGFPQDHYSPAPRRPTEPSDLYSAPQHDSPPRGPRQQGVPRAPSQKRPRLEDDYTAPFHAQKRFKDDRKPPAAPAWSPESDFDRPSLEHRLAAASDPNVHFIGRGESYRPGPDVSDRDIEWPSQDGLLSRLSDPGRGAPRGRGGARGRPNKPRGRGRGRGEMSLADRMG
ncbi:hypothetical protein C8R47DRAFT_1130917 [Mycena vitilis]|nr:hypothetical protein C8R47DRAFT_1130917 [Mycena vitilis]